MTPYPSSPPAALRRRARSLDLVERAGQQRAHRIGAVAPLTAFAGTSDLWAPTTTMRPWARETCSKFHLRLIGGGNTFFIGPALAGFTREIVDEIERCHDRGDAS